MSNVNQMRCYSRKDANNVKREWKAQRTAMVRQEVENLLKNPVKMEFLAHLFVFWLKEFNDAPGRDYEQKRRNRALLALDYCLQNFARQQWNVMPDIEYIKNAECPIDLPQGWLAVETDAKWANYATLPQKTWRYVFMKDGIPQAAFEDHETALDFFRFLKRNDADPHFLSGLQHQRKPKTPNRAFAVKEGCYWSIYRTIADGVTAVELNILPPMLDIDLRENFAHRAAAFYNQLAEENEAYQNNKKEQKK